MYFEIAIVSVGFTRKEALQLPTRGLGTQPLECDLGVRDNVVLALGFTDLDQFDGLGDLTLDPLVAADRLVEFGALAQQRLCGGRVIPQPRVLGLRVQLRKTTGCSLPVKDASSAAPTTC